MPNLHVQVFASGCQIRIWELATFYSKAIEREPCQNSKFFQCPLDNRPVFSLSLCIHANTT